MSFDKAAKNWDTSERLDRGMVISNEILKTIGENKDLVALEFGCGTGIISFGLKDNIKEIYCTDKSNGMLEELEKKIKANKIENMYQYKVEDIYSGNFEGKFDVIYSSMVFHHIVDIKDEIKKLSKLLKNNGVFILVDLDKEDGSFHKNEENFTGHNGFERAELQAILSSCDFEKVKFSTIFDGIKMVYDEEVKYSLFLSSSKIKRTRIKV